MKKLLLLSLLAFQVEANQEIIEPLPMFGVSSSVTRDAVDLSYSNRQLTCPNPKDIKFASNVNVQINFEEEKSGSLLVLGYDSAEIPASAIEKIVFNQQKSVEVDYKRLEGVPNLYYFIFDQQEFQYSCGAILLSQ
ncbi:hypothetical protein [Thiosulfativibrio zosterae]|uniref:Uncharacterized protein n=1 Tax=Thiosulfativibrio zosterae TaxID=2675053 RepID=A0A6F8PR20_9GAMM|nr:hypothetical protein [Thiosulfativibrio zosterae]BBP44526.1 hypothetical protein THMIRHAT_22720 [Thiosulfativibrio zosterae]